MFFSYFFLLHKRSTSLLQLYVTIYITTLIRFGNRFIYKKEKKKANISNQENHLWAIQLIDSYSRNYSLYYLSIILFEVQYHFSAPQRQSLFFRNGLDILITFIITQTLEVTM